MKLLLIVDDYLPYSVKVAAKMMHELGVELLARGHEITVITPNSNQKNALVEKNLDGVRVLYFRSGELKNSSKIKRAINESLLSFNAWTSAKKFFKANPQDFIIYYSPSIFWGSLVKKIKKLFGIKSYLILRDIFPQWAVDNHLLSKKSIAYLYFKYFENINYKAADYIGVMSPENLNYFNNGMYDISKFEVLYNWTKITELPNPQNNFRKELNLVNKTVFFYGGNIGHAQNMMNLINLAKRFKNNPNVHFLFVGKGDEVDLILSEKVKSNIENLTYLPPVDQETYFEMLNEFDIGLFSLHAGHKTHNFPGKLLGYMAYAKPILGSVNKGNDLKEIINESKSGFVFDNGEDDKLFEAALLLYRSFELRAQMGKNGKALLKKQFSVKRACDQIEKKLAT